MDRDIEQSYQVDALLLYDEVDLIATVTPRGLNIIGAEGMILIVGKYDTYYVNYFMDNGPRVDIPRPVNGHVREPIYVLSGVDKPGWYIISDPYTGMTRLLDAKLLGEILMEVSDYGI